jgi:hypothetical protein
MHKIIPSKIYTISSESHDVFLPWFYTIKNIYSDIEVIIGRIDQICETGRFKSNKWYEATLLKLTLITKLFENHDDDCVFIYSDTDVQFFKPFHSIINKLLETNDIIFQNDYPSACSGFFACKKNTAVKLLFDEAMHLLSNQINRINDDQVAINTALKNIKIKYEILPLEFFTYGYYNKEWHSLYNAFNIPNNIITHHANWTRGIENKLNLLKLVREKHDKNNLILKNGIKTQN